MHRGGHAHRRGSRAHGAGRSGVPARYRRASRGLVRFRAIQPDDGAQQRRCVRLGQRQPPALRVGREIARRCRQGVAGTAGLAARIAIELAGGAGSPTGRYQSGRRFQSLRFFMATTIADYALIGDCETGALVSRHGSIDWLCWPRFDSDACFAALLGTPDNGRWRIAPATEKFQVSRKYRKDTLILETRFETDEGVATLIDFMPLRNDTSDLMRLVVG